MTYVSTSDLAAGLAESFDLDPLSAHIVLDELMDDTELELDDE